MMNDYVDEVWFGAKEVFFKDGTPTAAVGISQGQAVGAICRLPEVGDHLRRSPLSGQPV